MEGQAKARLFFITIAPALQTILWLLFHAAGAMVNLIWIAIAVLVIIWLVGLVRGRSTAS